MYYFLFPSLLVYDFVLVIAAVVPAAFLMIKTYRSDRLEKESPALLWSLAKAGVFSSLIALVAERVLVTVLNLIVPVNSAIYNLILYFGIVAFTEEGAKYFMLKRHSWNSPEFNCQYDAIVYALFVSLGFALWENISYVMTYGFSIAIIRALTAIPGHACFGVFMGVFYGNAKSCDYQGFEADSKRFRILTVVVPAFLHGLYDYIATVETSSWYFVIYVAILFGLSFYIVTKLSKQDQYI